MSKRMDQLLEKEAAAREKADAAKAELKKIKASQSAERRKLRDKRIYDWGGYLDTRLIHPDLLEYDDVHRLLSYCLALPNVHEKVVRMAAIRAGETEGDVAALFGDPAGSQQPKAAPVRPSHASGSSSGETIDYFRMIAENDERSAQQPGADFSAS